LGADLIAGDAFVGEGDGDSSVAESPPFFFFNEKPNFFFLPLPGVTGDFGSGTGCGGAD